MTIQNSIENINKSLTTCVDCFDEKGIDSVRKFTHNLSILIGWVNSLETEVKYFRFDNESDKEKATSFVEKASNIREIEFRDILALLPFLLVESNTLLSEMSVKC